MMISAHFTDGGVPATGLSPVISIYNLDTDALVVDEAAMSEVGLGIYKYDFTTYDPTVSYAFIADGTVSLSNPERYKLGSNESDQTIYKAVAGSVGEAMMAYAKGKQHFNKETLVETLYREDGTTQVAQRTITDTATETTKE